MSLMRFLEIDASMLSPAILTSAIATRARALHDLAARRMPPFFLHAGRYRHFTLYAIALSCSRFGLPAPLISMSRQQTLPLQRCRRRRLTFRLPRR